MFTQMITDLHTDGRGLLGITEMNIKARGEGRKARGWMRVETDTLKAKG